MKSLETELSNKINSIELSNKKSNFNLLLELFNYGVESVQPKNILKKLSRFTFVFLYFSNNPMCKKTTLHNQMQDSAQEIITNSIQLPKAIEHARTSKNKICAVTLDSCFIELYDDEDMNYNICLFNQRKILMEDGWHGWWKKYFIPLTS